MKKVYVLTSFNLKNQFFNCKAYYSNRKAAEESRDLLIKNLKEAHDLDDSISEMCVGSQIIGGKFNVSLVDFMLCSKTSSWLLS